jgi:hypothetical protein
MKAKMSFILGAVVLTVACVSAQAQVPITGQINFTGGATLDVAIPNSTTFETFFGPSGSGGPVVQAGGGLPSGSYAGVPGNTVANFTAPFDFASPTLPFALWSFNFGGQTFGFQVNTVATDELVFGGAGFIDIAGKGTGTITGGATTYLATTEDWSITGTTANASSLTITIGESNVAAPEPSTLAFGGLGGLLSIATLIRRRK